MQMQEQLLLNQPAVGDTQVAFIVLDEPAGRKLHFVSPVALAPLQRKRVRTSKRLVPLIEPDICNYMRVDFLPESVLRRSRPTAQHSSDELDNSGRRAYGTG